MLLRMVAVWYSKATKKTAGNIQQIWPHRTKMDVSKFKTIPGNPGYSILSVFCCKRMMLQSLFDTWFSPIIYLVIHLPCCSVVQCCPTLCDPMDYSSPGFPVLYCLLELAEAHIHWVSDAIQPSCPLSSLSPPAFSLSQHQGLFQWMGFSHWIAKVLELSFCISPSN